MVCCVVTLLPPLLCMLIQGDCHVLDETFVSSLLSKKKKLQEARKDTSSILGWDVPFSTLKFSTALGSCKYGEVFQGTMDDIEVVVKTLKPDGGEMARESFDRELDLLQWVDGGH